MHHLPLLICTKNLGSYNGSQCSREYRSAKRIVSEACIEMSLSAPRSATGGYEAKGGEVGTTLDINGRFCTRFCEKFDVRKFQLPCLSSSLQSRQDLQRIMASKKQDNWSAEVRFGSWDYNPSCHHHRADIRYPGLPMLGLIRPQTSDQGYAVARSSRE